MREKVKITQKRNENYVSGKERKILNIKRERSNLFLMTKVRGRKGEEKEDQRGR